MAETRERAISRWHIVVVSLAAICFIAEASTGVSKKSRSLVDCLISRKMPSKFADRAILAAADTHTVFKKMGEYRGTRDQNLHLVADVCPERNTSYGYGRGRRSRESYATRKNPGVPLDLYITIRQAARDTARNHGLDEEKFLQTIGCESDGFDPNARNGSNRRGVDRGIAQINSYWHKEVSDAQAYNWRWSLGWAARTMKVERVKNGEVFSQAAYWYCYKLPEYLAYGTASIRAKPNQNLLASGHEKIRAKANTSLLTSSDE